MSTKKPAKSKAQPIILTFDDYDYIIGVDPGASSGISLLQIDDESFKLLDFMPVKLKGNNPNGLYERFETWKAYCDRSLVAIEDQFKNLNVKTVKRLSENSGIWRGVLSSLGFETFIRVYPTSWQSVIKKSIGRNKDEKVAEMYKRFFNQYCKEHDIKYNKKTFTEDVAASFGIANYTYHKLKKGTLEL